ncbi:alcohol dehydrogenase catalytic domain-containing protein [Staphylococcus aureus]|uniref:alcohol dehydrogenase catalytic domain-containing protein n=1 Tax=Staphylococcus aureus TaxID=1280 RepID=UPI001C831547|nr:alcohol dehydrogenase catalytic domain-containing protein [Staphylococcus aureus]
MAFHGIKDVRVDELDFPKLEMPDGSAAPHGVILKIVATNICGSDLHIYRGSFPAPEGMVLGHEMTGQVLEVGSRRPVPAGGRPRLRAVQRGLRPLPQLPRRPDRDL